MLDSKQIYDYLIKIQSIAKIGLTYSKDPYALTNYKEINDLTMKFLEEFLEIQFDRPNFFSRDIYPTPSISVRTVILNKSRDKVLMVREVNSHLYSLPGGWADLYDSPSETARNESRQEAGANINVKRLVALLHKTPLISNDPIPQYIAVFEGELVGELQEHEYETDDVNFFPIENLPPVSKKCSIDEIKKMITATVNGETIFD